MRIGGVPARVVAVVGACLAVLLTLCSGSALARYTAEVQGATLKVIGDEASDKLAVEVDPSDPSLLELDVGANGTADFTFPLASFTAINIQAGPGNDEVQVANGLADKSVTIGGGTGNDQLFGGDGNEVLQGGDGNDLVSGGRGNDTINLGTGSDTAVWNPGDASDTIVGGGGDNDTLDFNGANVSENIDIAATGGQVRLSRDVGNVTMTLDGIRRLNLTTRGGADNVTVDNLAGTVLRSVMVDLAGVPGTGTGDGQPDTVTAVGTPAADQVHFTRQSGNLVVTGLFAKLTVAGAEPSDDAVNVDGADGNDTATSNVSVSGPEFVGFDGGNGTNSASFAGSTAADAIAVEANGSAVDTSAPGASTLQTIGVEDLSVSGGDGNDTIDAGNGLAPLTNLTINGGNGDDSLIGGDGDDTILGGPGNDSISGGRGSDTVEMGDGADTFTWNPGDGSDTVEGQSGSDLFLFGGANVNENVSLSASGGRVRFTRDVGNVTEDLHGIETTELDMRGGADTVTVNDLTGTGMGSLGVDLAGIPGTGIGDGQLDTVIVNGTPGPDNVSATTLGGSEAVVDGLYPRVGIVGSEPGNDTLLISTLGGTDSVTVDPSVATLINPVVDLGSQ